MEFKNLAEVELLGEVPEGASVLAATAEGEVVRVPGDGLGGSGGGAFVVNITADWSTGRVTSDKTNTEIWEAVGAGQTVVAVIRDAESGTAYAQAVGGCPDASNDMWEFTTFELGGAYLYVTKYTVNEDGSVQLGQASFQGTDMGGGGDA